MDLGSRSVSPMYAILFYSIIFLFFFCSVLFCYIPTYVISAKGRRNCSFLKLRLKPEVIIEVIIEAYCSRNEQIWFKQVEHVLIIEPQRER